MAKEPSATFSAHFDSQQVPTITGVVGTLGTADTQGTARSLPIGVNPLTGAMYVEDTSGAAGTVNVQGSVTVIGGTVNPSNGTLNRVHDVGTLGSVIAVGQIHNAGTIQALPQVSVGTIPQVSVGTLPQVSVGTLPSDGTIVRVTSVGTSAGFNTGTVTTGSLTNIANLHNGTVVVSMIPQVSVGTIPQVSVGTLPNTNQVTGTVTTIVAGTQNTLGTVEVVNNIVKGTITRIEGGTINNLATGTVTVEYLDGFAKGTVTTGSLTNIAMIHAGTHVHPSGTVTTIVAGTQNTLGTVGNINFGTIRSQAQAVNAVTPFGTIGTAGGSFFGTISATSGAGTKHVISGVQIVATSGTPTVMVLIGTALNGNGILAQGAFPAPGGGIAQNFTVPIETGTNTELTYHFVDAGTARISVQYWKSTL